jgi:GxxExxY protein
MDTGEGGVNLLSKRIIGCDLTVLHALGTGFLERVYENALVHELRKSGFAVSQQHPMVVRYDGIVSENILLTYSSNTSSSSN